MDYDVYLHNQSYYKGTVQGETLSPKTKTELEFSSESSWERTVALFWDMLNAGETTAILEGEITLKFFIFTITLPFEKEVNIESYLKSFAATQAQNAINKAREKMQQGLGNVLSRLST